MRFTILLAMAICAGAASASSADPSPSPAPSPSTSAKTVAVAIKDFVYVPATVTVPVGTKVVFTNKDTTTHTATAPDKSFDSGDLDQGKSWSHVFATAGTFTYTCTYHAFMKGTVVVK